VLYGRPRASIRIKVKFPALIRCTAYTSGRSEREGEVIDDRGLAARNERGERKRASLVLHGHLGENNLGQIDLHTDENKGKARKMSGRNEYQGT